MEDNDGKLRLQFSECTGPALEPQQETPQWETRPCISKNRWKSTIILRERERRPRDRELWDRVAENVDPDSDGRQTPDGHRYGL